MISSITIALGALACCASAAAGAVSVDHAFGVDGEFRKRGSLEILIDSKTAVLPTVQLSADAAEMEDLIANDGLYRVRVATDSSSAHHIVAAIPACQLRLAGFREEITLHVEWDGLIVGLDYRAPVGPLASTRDCTKMSVPESSEISSRATVVRSASAQIVPLQVLVNSPPPGLQSLKEQIGTKDTKAAGSQSMLVKYWYIVVPLLIMFMFNQPEQPAASGPAAPATSGAR